MSGQKKLRLEDKLGLDRFDIDKKSHIEVNKEICKKCVEKVCLYICPARTYALEGEDLVHNYEGCLECGACRIACVRKAIVWSYPRGGFGVTYRHG